MHRVLIIGSAGARKSTLARRLGAITGLPVVHLDAHYWNAGWRPTPPDEWTRRVAQLLRDDAWIMDGNYGATLPERVDAADTVILLELSRVRCLYRVLVRSVLHRGRARADLNPDCPEQPPDPEFIRWIWRYPRRSLPRVRAILQARAVGRTIVTLRSPTEIERYLESVDASHCEPVALAAANRSVHPLHMSDACAVNGFPRVPLLLTVPDTPRALAAEARRIHAESVSYWSAYPPEEFFHRPAPEVWAPADQVRHLTRAVRAVNRGLIMPRLALVILFGWSRRPSRAFDALASDYTTALARGGRAGRFTPPAIVETERTEPGRVRIMAHHAAAIDAFARSLERTSDRTLDRYRLPHPLLGKLTLREMVYFTLLHNVHHVMGAERRRRGASDVGAT